LHHLIHVELDRLCHPRDLLLGNPHIPPATRAAVPALPALELQPRHVPRDHTTLVLDE
jgi:hypothetical protein